MDSQWIQNKKTILKKRNKKEDTLLNFKSYYKAVVIKTGVLAQKKTDTDGVELRAQK